MIILIRHAATRGGQGQYIGRTDLPLSEEGQAQARALAQALVHCGIRRVAASPLQRAQDTAAPLGTALGLNVQTMDELAEINLGQWEGVRQETIRTNEPHAHAARGNDFANFRTPGGESFADVQTRAIKALDALAGQPLPVAAITHSGVIRTILCHVQKQPLSRLFEHNPRHTMCTVLHPTKDGYRLGGTNLPPSQLPNP